MPGLVPLLSGLDFRRGLYRNGRDRHRPPVVTPDLFRGPGKPGAGVSVKHLWSPLPPRPRIGVRGRPRIGVRGRPGPRNKSGVTRGGQARQVRACRNPCPDPADAPAIRLHRRLAPGPAHPNRTAVGLARPATSFSAAAAKPGGGEGRCAVCPAPASFRSFRPQRRHCASRQAAAAPQPPPVISTERSERRNLVRAGEISPLRRPSGPAPVDMTRRRSPATRAAAVTGVPRRKTPRRSPIDPHPPVTPDGATRSSGAQNAPAPPGRADRVPGRGRIDSRPTVRQKVLSVLFMMHTWRVFEHEDIGNLGDCILGWRLRRTSRNRRSGNRQGHRTKPAGHEPGRHRREG